jgi:hypothetical protein
MRHRAFGVAWLFVVLAILQACASLPVDQQIDNALGAVAARQERANRFFAAGVLTKEEHGKVLKDSIAARVVIKDAEALLAQCKTAGQVDCASAESKLRLAEFALQELDLYIAKQAAKEKK